jgi:hypothetical protein
LIATLIALLCGPAALAGHRQDFEMEILVDGRPLHEYVARGQSYVEAIEGKEYAVRLTNRTGRRVAVALAVDGLNSIDANATTARDAAKWIVGPHRSIVIEGWQTGPDTARRFFFTTEDRSYGAWLGATEDLGIVTAAFFRERVPRPVPYESAKRQDSDASRSSGERPAAAPRGKVDQAASAEAESALSDEYAATGIGREVDHRVRRIRFDEEATPAAVFQVRYEYREALVQLGILPRHEDPLARRERATGFDDFAFAPDPYR